MKKRLFLKISLLPFLALYLSIEKKFFLKRNKNYTWIVSKDDF
tara:strand:- start:1231 stop:1359 length:129 start_codon:yes stop_codon:yes gene_type:complete